MAFFYLDRIYGIFWIIYWFHHFPDENNERQLASQSYFSRFQDVVDKLYKLYFLSPMNIEVKLEKDGYGCIWKPAAIKCPSAVITFSIPNSRINMKLVQSVNEKD